MLIWGVTAQSHEAAISVIKDKEILFASSSERYSKIKQDPDLHPDLINSALNYGEPEFIAYYENVWLKKSRQFMTGYFSYALDTSKLPSKYLKKFKLNYPIKCVNHHLSHASSGFYTSKFDESAVVVIDAIGEWQTISIWKANNFGINLIYEVNFPYSLGMLYSAFTKRCGLKPNEEEYILMGMAKYGNPIYAKKITEDFIDEKKIFSLRKPCHMGIKNYLQNAKKEDIAASIQLVTELAIVKIMQFAKRKTKSENLVYMGGVALNCVANNNLFDHFKNVWIMPSPGDSGSSIGCAAFYTGKLNWRGPYLGHEIKGEYSIPQACELLEKGEVIGVARGKAEFGPRALGNRSLLADPRVLGIKDKLNETKRRQKYRPFAPAIPLELAEEFFDMPTKETPYMQFICKCKYPEKYAGAVHVDGTSRLQTVKKEDNPLFYNLLMTYYAKTGCPMLLNTSLNIRGKPIVNDEKDAAEFEKLYKIKVL
jgi:carbamoyltransferase